jgi:hypothetical protein
LAIESHQSLMGLTNTPSELLPGTPELLILETRVSGSKHGYGIVEHLRLTSDDVLRVGESALSPALQRSLFNGWVKPNGVLRTIAAPATTQSAQRAASSWQPNAPSSIVWLVRFSACWRRPEGLMP